MYQVDDRDRVERLSTFPPCCTGAPEPWIAASEHEVALAYCVADDIDWDGDYDEVLRKTGKPAVALVRISCTAHMFGGPNDEALHGHPLASRGLEPYGVFRVIDSSWIRTAERVNSVHPRHDPSSFLARLTHYVFTFHDSTFECLARAEPRVSIEAGAPREVVASALREG